MSETPFDLDGDGNPDVIEYDYDGDGAADETIIDMDGDGVFETTLIDLDGDGYQETIISVEGETVVIDTDTDGDGDSDVLEVDIDGDGIIDETWIDTDDDGIVDTLVEPSTGEPITDDPVVSDPTTDPGTDVTIEPASSEELVDRGEYEAAFWQFQEENGFCAPTSVAIIFSEMFGQTLPKEIFVERAIELGLLDWTADGWSGLDIPGIEQLMESFGVPATTLAFEPAEAWGALDDLTEENYGVIVYVDSDEVWGTETWEGHDLSVGLQMDHALVVSHIEGDTVYLNDPGNPDGQQYTMQRDAFMDAWSDSGYQMLTTDQPVYFGGYEQSGADVAPVSDPFADPEQSTTVELGAGTEGADTTDGAETETEAAAVQASTQSEAMAGYAERLVDALDGLRVAILPVVLSPAALTVSALSS